MPERLYGRDAVLAELIKSVEDIGLGRVQLLLTVPVQIYRLGNPA